MSGEAKTNTFFSKNKKERTKRFLGSLNTKKDAKKRFTQSLNAKVK